MKKALWFVKMIRVTRLNDKELYINCEMIEFVESTPDTVISMDNDKKIIVRESVDEIVGRIIAYHRKIKVLPDCGDVVREEVF